MRTRRPLVWLALLTLVVLAGVSAVAFQDDTFKPLKPGDPGQETLPATPLVFVAYAFVWTLLLGYVFLLWRKLGRVERELAEVNARLRTGPRTP
ncbi:MAG TPA: CcmD family protein [Vicinamibacterales bacterium]|nr:CcmD family protein [Vicinamibacterales bacterium]